MGEEGQRRWAGTTLDVRRAARREQLIEVGFALLGEQGAAAVTVRGVARAAHLSERYFYESFSDRDALLLAVHDRVAEQARTLKTIITVLGFAVGIFCFGAAIYLFVRHNPFSPH